MKGDPDRDLPENIIFICANCHEDRHGGPCGRNLNGIALSHTPEARKKKSSTMKLRWQQEDYREKTLARIQAGLAKLTPEQLKAKGDKIRLSWTPERIEKQLVFSHTPEAQEKRAQTMKELWSDPEYRAKQLASRRESWAKRKAQAA